MAPSAFPLVVPYITYNPKQSLAAPGFVGGWSKHRLQRAGAFVLFIDHLGISTWLGNPVRNVCCAKEK